MKIYTLLNSETIDNITTYRIGLTTHMEINYKKTKTENTQPKEYSFMENTVSFFKSIYGDSIEQNRVVTEHDIGYTVRDLLKEGLIDYDLAFSIKKEYLHLFADIDLFQYNSHIKTPYECTEIPSETAYKPTTNRYTRKQHIIQQSSETLILTEEEKKMIEESIEYDQLYPAVISAKEQKPNYTCSPISKYGFSTEVHTNNTHKIANFTCEFKYDDKLGLLLLISSDKTSEQTAQVSDKNRRDIFKCHQLSDLIGVLKPLNNTESIINTLERFNVKQIKPGFDI